MSALEDLDLFLAGDNADVDEFVVEPPADAEAADFMLRRLARRYRLIDEAREAAAAVITRTREWEATTTAPLRREAEQLEAALRDFHQELLAGDSKRTSIALPAGTLKSKQNPGKVDVVDEDRFVRWAMAERPALLRTEHKPVKAEIKRLLAVDGSTLIDPTSGEKVPGLVAIAGERSFWIAFDSGSEAGE